MDRQSSTTIGDTSTKGGSGTEEAQQSMEESCVRKPRELEASFEPWPVPPEGGPNHEEECRNSHRVCMRIVVVCSVCRL